LDLITSRRLVEEIAPLVAGARVTSVHTEGPECLVLKLAGTPDRLLGAVTMKALPILFLSEGVDCSPNAPSDSPFGGQLKGATIERLEPLPDRPGGALLLRWTSLVGRTAERRLTIDLGRSPSISLVDAGADLGAESDAYPSTVREQDVSPRVSTWHDEHGRLHARLSSVPRAEEAAEETREFGSLNEGAVYMFSELWPDLSLEQRRHALRRVIERRVKRARRAMEKVQAEIDDSVNADLYRHMGQLLLTKQGEVRKGAESVTLKDYDGSTDVVIALDPTAGPQQNAESYFRRARKAERRLARAPLRLGELEAKAADYEAAAELVDAAPVEELERLEARFAKQRPATNPRKAQKERARFRTYRISGGWEVLVGKSNRDNDVLSHQIARPSDLWFHARQVAGSHVVLRRAGSKAEPDKTAILEAAAIAAFHSKAGKSSKVSVCYTEKRHVRKARGGKPGEAVVAREKVVLVAPRLPES